MPGWLFTLYQHPHEGIWLAITFEAVDSNDWSKTVTNCVRTPVPPMPHARYFYEWLVWRLERIAIHEVCEFARVDGVMLHDPHAPGANDEPA